jgi:hypothetical protein
MFAKNAAIPPAQLPGTFRAADDHPPMTDENGAFGTDSELGYPALQSLQ